MGGKYGVAEKESGLRWVFLWFVMLGSAIACGNTTSNGDASAGASGAISAGSGGSTAAASGGSGPLASTGSAGGGSTFTGCDSSVPSGNYFGAALASSTAGASGAPKCLPRKLTAGADGRVPCSVVALSPEPCACDAALGMQAAPAALANAAWQQFSTSGAVGGAGSVGAACSDWCVCELTQLSGDALSACQTEPNANSPPGFCYLDLQDNPATEALLTQCPTAQKRLLRFLAGTGPGSAQAAAWFIECTGNPLQP